MARLLKCYGFCEGKYPKEELVKVGSHNYCKPCAEKKEKEQNDRNILYKTIQTVFKIPFPNGMMLKQISQFIERGYTLEGLTKTICYFVKVQKQTPNLRGNLSFVPYHYDSAIKYYNDLNEKRKNIKDIDNNVKVLKIKPKQSSNNELRDKKFINMEELLNDK